MKCYVGIKSKPYTYDKTSQNNSWRIDIWSSKSSLIIMWPTNQTNQKQNTNSNRCGSILYASLLVWIIVSPKHHTPIN